MDDIIKNVRQVLRDSSDAKKLASMARVFKQDEAVVVCVWTEAMKK